MSNLRAKVGKVFISESFSNFMMVLMITGLVIYAFFGGVLVGMLVK